LYNNGIYEYQQVQSVYDSDGHQEELLVSDDTSECASSESFPVSGCGRNSSDGSDEAVDTLSDDGVDGREEVSAHHVRSITSNVQIVTAEPVVSEGESSVNDLDSVYEFESDHFSDTGCIDMEEVIPEAAGVRGPQSVSVLFPQDCKKLIQVCRGIQRIQQCDEQIKRFQSKVYVKKLLMLFMKMFLIH
jgi:hypothetical protein